MHKTANDCLMTALRRKGLTVPGYADQKQVRRDRGSKKWWEPYRDLSQVSIPARDDNSTSHCFARRRRSLHRNICSLLI